MDCLIDENRGKNFKKITWEKKQQKSFRSKGSVSE